MYNLHDKVYIRSLNKEGVIAGYHHTMVGTPQEKTTYEISYEGNYWDHDQCLPVSEYLGKKYVRVKVEEHDLQDLNSYCASIMIKPKEKLEDEYVHMIDAIKYMVVGLDFKPNASGESGSVLTVKDGTATWEKPDTIFGTSSGEQDPMFRAIHSKDLPCPHSWKTYDSGWSRYEYCEKCDVKK